MIQEKSFGVIMFHQDQGVIKCLLVHHRSGNHWSFPKGRPESDETPVQTAKRELEEETGIVPDRFDGNVFFEESYQFVRDGKNINKTVRYYMAHVDKPEVKVQKGELHDCCWVPLDRVEKKITFDDVRELFQKVQKYLKSHN